MDVKDSALPGGSRTPAQVCSAALTRGGSRKLVSGVFFFGARPGGAVALKCEESAKKSGRLGREHAAIPHPREK